MLLAFSVESASHIVASIFGQVFNDAIEALRISYKKMNPFCVPFATTNMGSAILAMDLVKQLLFYFPSTALNSICFMLTWTTSLNTGVDGPKLLNIYCLCN